ncbi:MAG: hypothetical protein JO029_16155 [Candidatus Eremiobacteraeota bacterium]|nr:hypothetical protein [Candidatus Eremiobacteraeota bacterium]MBV8284025.1 hypothetical protein [Candidatus Eremiobacteraeota bacterium]MBV8435816.1 hypothetical protein [Candidatus Eremiobacteraeota bacterium]MBV8655783.1 hypothetical protein [Candidatus Eremiobacteraeota bacterium]
MMRTFVMLTGIVALACGVAQANIVSNYGISIQSCVVNQNGSSVTNGINVVYTNTHAAAANEVDFLIGYRGHRYVLRDTGTFTQGAQINHNLTNALVGFGWTGPTPNRCTVKKVVLSDGNVLGE